MNKNEYCEVMNIVSEELLGIHINASDGEILSFEVIGPKWDCNNPTFVNFELARYYGITTDNLITVYNSIANRLYDYMIDNEKKRAPVGTQFFLRKIYNGYNGGDAIMKAKTFIIFTILGFSEAAVLYFVYKRGQVKGLQMAREIIEDCKNKFKSAEEEHD